ncbi:MAG: GDYXXLXY domain-containing protein [Bacteroidota bacterium]
MSKSLSITLLFILFAIQLFVPAQMIYQQEDVLSTGTAYKFKTQPIDPSDPLRGKYIDLYYEIDSFETNDDSWNGYHGKVFVYLKTDAEGFAAVKTVSKTQLDTSDDYFTAKSNFNYNGKVNFDIPFNRFYMNEYKAYDAEISVRKAQQDTTRICYGLVHIKQGTAVLSNVFIDDIPIADFVEKYRKDRESSPQDN